MNQLLTQIESKYSKIIIDEEIKTNKELMKSIIAIETAHRNILWRICEYIVFLIFPYSITSFHLLTIGKLQVKVSLLKKVSKLEGILLANNYHFLDLLLKNRFPTYKWSSLSDVEIRSIVKFYNGDKSEEYFKYIKSKLYPIDK